MQIVMLFRNVKALWPGDFTAALTLETSSKKVPCARCDCKKMYPKVTYSTERRNIKLIDTR